MLDAIKQFVDEKIFGAGRTKPESPPDAPAPEGAPALPPTQIAAAALLLEIAHADGEFTAKEIARIEGALDQYFGLDEETRKRLLELGELERAQSIDHFQFTKRILDEYDVGQRMLLAELLWGVALADGEISTHESYLTRKIGSLLQLEPAYLAQARKAAQR